MQERKKSKRKSKTKEDVIFPHLHSFCVAKFAMKDLL